MRSTSFRRALVASALVESVPAFADDAPVRPEFGVLALGLFVGAILGFAMKESAGKLLRTATTAVGIALGAGPIFFLQGSGSARWTYPLGLVLGLALVPGSRAVDVVEKDYSPDERLDKGRRGRNRRRSAWVQIAVVVAAVVSAAVWSALPP